MFRKNSKTVGYFHFKINEIYNKRPFLPRFHLYSKVLFIQSYDCFQFDYFTINLVRQISFKI